MALLKWRLALGLFAGIFGLTMVSRAEDDAGVLALPNRSFIHKESKTVFKAPTGWNIIAPYRLRKTATSTVLSLEKDDARTSNTIVWSPLYNRAFSDVIRAAEDDKLGEEWDVLMTIYGKDKLTRPTTIKVGPYTVYKILIDDGPDRDGLYAGAVYLFEAGSGDQRWKVKVRANFPKLNRDEHLKAAEEVVQQFSPEE